MARRKRRKPTDPKVESGGQPHTDSEIGEEIANADGVDSAPSDSSTPIAPTWKAVVHLLLTVAIVAFVFTPWLNRYIDGQFLGLSGEYGTDFFRYSQGSEALIRLDLDPYDNAEMFQALEDERLRTDHPNAYFDMQTSIKSFADTPEPVAKGVVSPPFLLVMIAPLVSVFGFTLALNLWVVASLLGISWISVLFWRRLAPVAPMWKQVASHSAMLSLLVLSGFPVLWSAVYGQFESIYFLAIGGSIYLWTFHASRSSTPLLVGLFLAIGGAIKLFPLILIGYFLWQAVRAYRQLPDDADRSLMRISQVPEMKVVLFGLGFFALINLITAMVFGFELYGSFVNKVADLQSEGAGPSMKGNLLSYLNFMPIWLSSPFSQMSTMWIPYGLITASLVVVIATSFRSMPAAQEDLASTDAPWDRLLEMTLIVAALPTLLPHWWIYYNVVLILPLIACMAAARETTNRRARWAIVTLTALSFALTFSYLTTSVFFGAFPNLYNVLINRPSIDAALALASSNARLLEDLPYSSAFGEPYAAEIEGRVPSVFNVFFGYPGAAMLLVANGIALRSKRGVPIRSLDRVPASSWWTHSSRAPLRRGATVVAALLLSLAGGHIIVWQGTRLLSAVPPVEFVTEEHQIENGKQYVDQLIESAQKIARAYGPTNGSPDGSASAQPSGVVADLIPPRHFIDTLAQSDRALAAALLHQDRRYFDDPRAAEKLTTIFAQYQANLNEQYAKVFNGEAPEGLEPSQSLNWRYRGCPGGLLEALEQSCREQSVSLRRLDQDWMLWQTQFLYEYTWQKALTSFSQGDVKEFVRFVFEHQGALSRHAEMLKAKIAEWQVSRMQQASREGSQRDNGHFGFVYVQTPAFTALSTLPEFLAMNDQASMETGVFVGTTYVLEELLRRARLAKTGNPHEALKFARDTINQITDEQIVAWWSEPGGDDVEGLLLRMSQAELFSMKDIETVNLLIWESF